MLVNNMCRAKIKKKFSYSACTITFKKNSQIMSLDIGYVFVSGTRLCAGVCGGV